jgi:hypothetical protein
MLGCCSRPATPPPGRNARNSRRGLLMATGGDCIRVHGLETVPIRPSRSARGSDLADRAFGAGPGGPRDSLVLAAAKQVHRQLQRAYRAGFAAIHWGERFDQGPKVVGVFLFLRQDLLHGAATWDVLAQVPHDLGWDSMATRSAARSSRISRQGRPSALLRWLRVRRPSVQIGLAAELDDQCAIWSAWASPRWRAQGTPRPPGGSAAM